MPGRGFAVKPPSLLIEKSSVVVAFRFHTSADHSEFLLVANGRF